jgi:hypothetical protein
LLCKLKIAKSEREAIMEIIYCKQESRELIGSATHPPGRYRKLQFENFRVEARKRKLETKNWIRKRGYWKPETSCSAQQACKESKLSKPSNEGFRGSVQLLSLVN